MQERKDRFDRVHEIAKETHSVLYQFNKENLKSFFRYRENVIILDYFLTLAREVLDYRKGAMLKHIQAK